MVYQFCIVKNEIFFFSEFLLMILKKCLLVLFTGFGSIKNLELPIFKTPPLTENKQKVGKVLA